MFDAIKKMIGNFIGKFSVGPDVTKGIKNVSLLGGSYVATKMLGVDSPEQTAVVSGAIFTLLDAVRNFAKHKFNLGWL